MKTAGSTDAESPISARANEKQASDLSLRDRYVLEAERIRAEIGDLDQILETLAINQRKACQLLLVDPSAWTRWRKTGAPPHIYQALRWLVQLKKSNPEMVGPTDMSSRIDHIQTTTQKKIKELETNLAMVERALTFTPTAQASDSFALEAVLAQQEMRFQQTIKALQEKIEELSAKVVKHKAAPKKAKAPVNAKFSAKRKPWPKSAKLKPKAKSKAQPKSPSKRSAILRKKIATGKTGRSSKPKVNSKTKAKQKSKKRTRRGRSPARRG